MENNDVIKIFGHPELKEHMDSAKRLIEAEEYRAAAGELRQGLEYLVSCYMEEARAEEPGEPVDDSLYHQIEFLKSGDWISFSQADSFHSIRIRCNAGVHRNADPGKKKMTPADIRYCYELLLQELPDFLTIFPGEDGDMEEPETKEPETKEPETREPETKEPETKKSETREPAEAEKEKTELPGAQAKNSGSEFSVLEDRMGEATEGVFSEMMEKLLRKWK